jgi:hypothetical protein
MSGVGMPPYRRKGISNAVVIAVAMMILLVGFLSYAYMGRIGAEYLGKALPEKLRQEGERGSELIRIYIWSRNHTLEGEPVITILNVWGKDSEIDVFMVANRTGHVVNVVALGPPMKVPASTAVELSPSALGLAYRTFGELIEYVGGVLAHTVLGQRIRLNMGRSKRGLRLRNHHHNRCNKHNDNGVGDTVSLSPDGNKHNRRHDADLPGGLGWRRTRNSIRPL